MAESKSAALPLGYAPMHRRIAAGRPQAIGRCNIAARPQWGNVISPRGIKAAAMRHIMLFRLILSG